MGASKRLEVREGHFREENVGARAYFPHLHAPSWQPQDPPEAAQLQEVHGAILILVERFRRVECCM